MTTATDELISQVKNYLTITWSDNETDSKISTLTNDAIDAMNHKLGSEDLNYSEAGAYRRLFLNYCLYAYNGCTEQFDDAYMKELNQCRRRLVIGKLVNADDEEG